MFYKAIIQIFITFNTTDCELQGFVVGLAQNRAYIYCELVVEYDQSLPK